MATDKEHKALSVVERLRGAGFEAYLAGGCVRDRLLGITAQDYDIATNARPEVVQSMFANTIAVGARFGVIVVVVDGARSEGAPFRPEAPCIEGRGPSAVHYGTMEEDGRRRDFTIGGMYLDPVSG